MGRVDAMSGTDYDVQDLDKLLQHRTRLGISVLLSQRDAIKFTRLRALLGETDGNLGAHLRKLEDAGYVSVQKEFVERKPVSWYALTEEGRRALQAHLDVLQAVIDDAATTTDGAT